MKYSFSKEIYLKESLIKSAYTYIDEYYVHLDADELYYYVTLERKDGQVSPEISEEEFKNEMLIQQTRCEIWEKTKDIRKLVYARALASTIVDIPNDIEAGVSYDENSILKDWFDEYE